MKISAVNTQNNNYSNKQYKPSFGMRFSTSALEGIERCENVINYKNARVMTNEIALALEKLKDNPDSCVMDKFGISAARSYYFNIPRVEFLIDVKDKHGISVHKADWKKMSGKKILEQLQYLTSDSFKRKVAKLDKPNQAKAAVIDAKRRTKQAEEEVKDKVAQAKERADLEASLRTHRILDYVKETIEPHLVKSVLPEFVEAQTVICKLIRQGVDNKQDLLDMAKELQDLNKGSLEKKLEALEAKSS